MKKNFVFAAVALFLVTLPALSQTASAAKAAPAGPSLYKRLGGYDAIAAVSDDFIGRMAADKQLARFLVGLSDNSKAHLRQLVVDQLCAATGGPCLYIGRDMKTAHKGLGITGADWELAVKYLVESLDKFKVPEKEKGEFLALASSLKADIVEKP
jgi:hemoglobin